MREKNRKPIASIKKLPQFTTMNVIDGQAGLISYFSLIFYSLTIDNILNIVILIILATVGISFVFGEDGLIARAQQSAELTKVENIKEQMELAKAEVAMENGGKVNAEDFFEKLEQNGVIGSVENDVTDNGDGTYEVVTDDGYEFEVTVTPEGEIEIEYTGKGEGPRISNVNITKTSNSVTIEVEAKNAEGGKFTYSYKKNSEGEESWQEAETNTTSNTCTIENLDANEIYNIKINIETNKGKVEKIVNIQIGEMPQGAITFDDYVWQGDGTANIIINTTEIGYTLQYQIVGAEGGMPADSSWIDTTSGATITGLKYGDTVYGRLWDGTNESDYANATIEDKIAPEVNVTLGSSASNSIKVNVEATDAESGMGSSVQYTYYIKNSAEQDAGYEAKASNITENTYTFTGLTQGTSYDIKVEVTGDAAGNTGTGYLTNQTTESIPGGDTGVEEGAITFGNTTWSNGIASITVSTNTSYKIEYQINTTEAGNWTEIESNGQISSLKYGDTVYARLTDGSNIGDYANATVEDKLPPQAATIQLSGTITDIEGSVTAIVTLKDNESGVNVTESKWVYNTTSGNIGIDEGSYTNNFTTNSEQITLKSTTIGTYYLHVLTKDIAGNKTEKVSEAITIEEPPQPGDPIDGTLAVGPQVADGMTPVKYIDGIGWVKTTSVDREWYNYGEKKWANVVLGGASFNVSGSYEVLDENATYTMLVWIPRYAYKITSMYRQGGSGAGNIDIVFLDTANKDKDGNDYSSKTTYPSASMQSGMSDFVVHPAFTWDGKALEGLWIGKYEASSNGGNIQIKAGVESWSQINISQMFTTCLGMNSYGNSYGLNANDSIVDPHMMKNIEWGAVTYLTQSIYGKNSEVAINNSSDYYTGGGRGTSYRTNLGQSTTGNITGIYDMSGGRGEYLAAYYGSGSSYGSSIQSAATRYKDIYTSDYYDIPTSTSKAPYGDALFETKRLV